MKRIKRVLLGVIVSLFLMSGGVARAAEDETNGPVLGITPTQNNIATMKPGETYTGSFKVRNKSGEGSFRYNLEVTPYSIANENYEPNYEKETQYTDITEWIKLDKTTGEIDAGQEEEVSYTVDVPEDAHGGAQAATIMVSMGGDGDSGGIQAVRRLGYLVFGNVEGETIETAQIVENKVPGLFFHPPVVATSLVKNTGNVYTNAVYTLQVFSLFGDEEIYTNEDDPVREIVFPETERLHVASWEGAPQLGIFRVRQTVKIFGETATEDKIVFLCPIWFMTLVLLVIFVAIFWIISRVRSRRN